MRGGEPAGLRAHRGARRWASRSLKALHALLEDDEELSVKQVAERLGLSLPGASRTVEALLQRGLLERREDADDRRVKRVRLTDHGRDVVHRIESARLAGAEQYLAALTPEQRDRLLRRPLRPPRERHR